MRIQHCCTYCNTLIKSYYVFKRFILKMAPMFNRCFFLIKVEQRYIVTSVISKKSSRLCNAFQTGKSMHCHPIQSLLTMGMGN